MVRSKAEMAHEVVSCARELLALRNRGGPAVRQAEARLGAAIDQWEKAPAYEDVPHLKPYVWTP